MHRILFIVVGLLISIKTFGQEQITTVHSEDTQNTFKKNIDSTSIVSFIDKIIIKSTIDTQSNSYTLKTEGESDLRIATNDQYRLVLSLDYEFIGASIGFAPKFLPANNDDELKGESSYADYKFRFFLGNWTQEVQYKRIQGYYLENTQDFLDDWIEGQDEYITLPSLKSTFYGGSTSYVLNPEFSLRNTFYNTEWQRKSAGSFIPTLRYGYLRLSQKNEGTKDYENNFDINISPEYHYTRVIKQNWFISFFASPAIGIRFSNDYQGDIETIKRYVYVPISLDGGLQIGYSSRKIIFGANLKFDTTFYNEDKANRLTNNEFYTNIYFGYRFNSPKKVQQAFNWMNQQLGL